MFCRVICLYSVVGLACESGSVKHLFRSDVELLQDFVTHRSLPIEGAVVHCVLLDLFCFLLCDAIAFSLRLFFLCLFVFSVKVCSHSHLHRAAWCTVHTTCKQRHDCCVSHQIDSRTLLARRSSSTIDIDPKRCFTARLEAAACLWQRISLFCTKVGAKCSQRLTREGRTCDIHCGEGGRLAIDMEEG